MRLMPFLYSCLITFIVTTIGILSTYINGSIFDGYGDWLDLQETLAIALPVFFCSAIILSNFEYITSKGRLFFCLHFLWIYLICIAVHRIILKGFNLTKFLNIDLIDWRSNFWWAIYGYFIGLIVANIVYHFSVRTHSKTVEDELNIENQAIISKDVNTEIQNPDDNSEVDC